jgi:hypothetical protein
VNLGLSFDLVFDLVFGSVAILVFVDPHSTDLSFRPEQADAFAFLIRSCE